MDYKDLETALASAMRAARSSDKDSLTELLELTAGTDAAQEKVYRPFYAAARYLRQNPQKIMEAEGVKFDDVHKAIRSQLRMQAGIDEQLELSVPEQWQAVMPIKIFPGVVR